jgi:SWI/SNF-related matrix-associated actin-dependent regulator 1 of chromatin subfamily A
MTYYIKEWPLLILCPASLRHTWPAEIEKFVPSLPASAVYVVSGFKDADFYANERSGVA